MLGWIIIATCSAVTLAIGGSAFAQPAPTVEVTGGAVRGYLAAPGAVFKAMPFAEPPVGALRWREPQPVQPWRGVRDATRYSAACVQNPTGTGTLSSNPWRSRYGKSYPTPQWDLSEDCLYLNVRTPEWPAKEAAGSDVLDARRVQPDRQRQ
jgi:para-nitrobenzyl esterase